MRRFPLGLAIMASIASAQSGNTDTVPLGEVHNGSAMALADRLLPPAIRGRVVEGTIRRQWLPGRVYWIGYRERGRPAEHDQCERTAHSVVVSGPTGLEDALIADTPLRIGTVETWREVAVLAPGMRAAADLCERAHGYISTDHQPERQVAAYRVLVAAMTAARSAGALPFELECEARDPTACRDRRAAMATLPMDALLGISISCTDTARIVDDSRPNIRLIGCRPLEPGGPYKAEVAFGMSGDDGDSWRVSFVHAARWPQVFHLRRSSIHYH